MSIVSYMPIVECKYGWGRVLRLYRDGLSLGGMFYALSELERVYATYHRVLGVSSARLELEFKRQRLIVPGIADVLLAQKIVDYVTYGSAATEAISTRAMQNAYNPVMVESLPGMGGVPGSSALSYSWEYDANDVPTTVDVIPAISLPILAASSSQSAPLLASLQASTLVGNEPWSAMPDDERVHRLKRLQAERELRVYGFDIQALSRRLHDAPLPLVLSPLNLLAGETAHYSIEASLSIESTLPSARKKRRIKDRGKLILTNKRLLYLGSRRQVVLEYEKVLRACNVSGALALDIEHIRQRQFFEMRRPLECSLYLRRLMEDARMSWYKRNVVSQGVLSLPGPLPPSSPFFNDVPAQKLQALRGQETLKRPVKQICPPELNDEDEDITQKMVRPVSRSL